MARRKVDVSKEEPKQEAEEPTTMATYDTYKGHDLIVLGTPDARFPFRFGKSKAKLIVEHYEEIRKFAEA